MDLPKLFLELREPENKYVRFHFRHKIKKNINVKNLVSKI